MVETMLVLAIVAIILAIIIPGGIFIYQEFKRKRSDAKIIAEIKKRDQTEELEVVLRRVRGSLKLHNISIEDLIKKFHKPILALLAYKDREKFGKKTSNQLKTELISAGFKPIAKGLYILPPIKAVNLNLENSETIGKWFDDNVASNLPKGYEYVISLVPIDIQKVFSRRIAPEKAWAQTFSRVLGPEEVLPSNFLLKFISVESLIKSGDIAFLASKFCSESELLKLQDFRDAIIKEIFGLKSEEISLRWYLDLNVDDLTLALQKYKFESAKKLSEGIIAEAKFWNAFLEQIKF